jgi:AraC-like DNA-binding protein
LIAAVLQSATAERVASGGPRSARARHGLAAAGREALAAHPERTLTELARQPTVSPHHLSRVFSAITGHTVSRRRMRLRTRAALERLTAGQRDLARVAADLGLTDQSHLCRVLRSDTSLPPSALRRLLT